MNPLLPLPQHATRSEPTCLPSARAAREGRPARKRAYGDAAVDQPLELVRFRVDGERFEVGRDLIESEDSVLRALVARYWTPEKAADPCHEILLDLDKKTFRYLLCWIRHGEIPGRLPAHELDMLRRQAKLLELAPLHAQLRLMKATDARRQWPSVIASLKVADAAYSAELPGEAWEVHAEAWEGIRDSATYERYCVYYGQRGGRASASPWQIFMDAMANAASAEELLPRAAELEERAPETPMSWCLRAKWHCSLGDYDLGQAKCAQALSLHSEFPEALALLGQCLQRLQAPDSAAPLARALVLRPNYPQARLGRGLSLLGEDRASDALADIDAALTIWPQYPEALCARGRALASVGGRLGEAEEAFAQAAAWHHAGYPEARCSRGGVLVQQGRFSEALSEFDEVIEICPDSYVARWGRAHALFHLGRLPAARATADEARRLGPDSTPTHCACGEVHVLLHRPNEE